MVLDQTVIILKGTPIQVSYLKWDNGEEDYSVCTIDTPSQEYLSWIQYMLKDDDGEEYDYDEGIAP